METEDCLETGPTTGQKLAFYLNTLTGNKLSQHSRYFETASKITEQHLALTRKVNLLFITLADKLYVVAELRLLLNEPSQQLADFEVGDVGTMPAVERLIEPLLEKFHPEDLDSLKRIFSTQEGIYVLIKTTEELKDPRKVLERIGIITLLGFSEMKLEAFTTERNTEFINNLQRTLQIIIKDLYSRSVSWTDLDTAPVAVANTLDRFINTKLDKV